MKFGILTRSLSLTLMLLLVMTTLNLGAFAAKPGTITGVTILTSDFSMTLGADETYTFEVAAKYGSSKAPLIWEASDNLSEVSGPAVKANQEKMVYSFVSASPGTYPAEVTVTDGSKLSDTLYITFTVEGGTPDNNPPVANGLSLTTDEDTAVTGTVQASDQDGDALTATITSGPSKGTAEIVTGLTVAYTPDPDYNGNDVFTVTVEDGKGGSDTAVVSITVEPVDDMPVAVADSATAEFNMPVIINVLANDTDVDGGPMTVESTSVPGNGTVVINSDHSVTYTPQNDFSGTDSFTYTLNGGSSATVTVTVNDAVSEPLKYVALGDSIPYGTYYSSFWNYLAGGTDTDSYVEQLARTMNVESGNFIDASVSGHNTKDVLDQIDSMTAAVSAADVITLCVGANDIMDAASRSLSGLNKYDIDWSAAADGRDNFELYWPQLIDKIENLNSDVTLVVMTIYNPYRISDSYYELVDPFFSSGTGDMGLNYIIENTMSLDDTWGNLIDDNFDYRIADVYTAFNNHSNKDSLTGFYRSFCDPHPNQLGQDVIFDTHIEWMSNIQ